MTEPERMYRVLNAEGSMLLKRSRGNIRRVTISSAMKMIRYNYFKTRDSRVKISANCQTICYQYDCVDLIIARQLIIAGYCPINCANLWPFVTPSK